MPDQNKLLRLIASLSTCTFGGAQAIMIALYLAIALSLKMDLTTVIYCASVGTFLFLFGSPYWSNTTDKLSRSAVMLIGTTGLFGSFCLVVFLVNYPLTNLSLVTWLFLLSQIVYGLIASATVPAALVLQTKLVDVNQTVKASFTHTMSLNVGRIIGYVLIVFFYNNYVQVLLLYAVLILMVLILQLFTLSKDKLYSVKNMHKTSWLKEIVEIRWIIAMAILYTCYLETLIFSLADSIQKQFHLDTIFASGFSAKILLVLSIGIFVGQYVGKQLFKDSCQLGMIAGFLSLLSGSIILIYAELFMHLWVAVGCIVIGLGLLPALYLALLRSENPQSYGKRAGIIAAAHTVGYTAGGFLAGYVSTSNSLAVGYYLAAITILLGLTLYKQITSSQQANERQYEYENKLTGTL